MVMHLYEHNHQAYEAAVRMLAERGKAAVIHPTGTGKSFIGFKLCADKLDLLFDKHIRRTKKSSGRNRCNKKD